MRYIRGMRSGGGRAFEVLFTAYFILHLQCLRSSPGLPSHACSSFRHGRMLGRTSSERCVINMQVMHGVLDDTN